MRNSRRPGSRPGAGLCLVLAVALVVVAGCCHAVAAPAVTDEQRQAVLAAVRLINLDQLTPDAEPAIAKLVALGKDQMPAMQAVLGEPAALVTPEELQHPRLTAERYKLPNDQGWVVDGRPVPERQAEFKQTYTDLRAAALDEAIARLTWGFTASDVVNKWLAAHRTGDQTGEPPQVEVTRVAEPFVGRMLPGYLLCTHVVRMRPVARMPVPPLAAHNIFALDAKGGVTQITDLDGLTAFFTAHLPPVKDEAAAKDALRAWLRLGAVLYQDGSFRLTIPDDELKVPPDKAAADGAPVARLTVEGVTVAAPEAGDRGSITGTLGFDAQGKLVSSGLEAALKAGMRPICQATKLLDPDPVVRAMAEQDLLVMGRRCDAYLREKRATAPPALQAAIDRIWQRILAGESFTPPPPAANPTER